MANLDQRLLVVRRNEIVNGEYAESVVATIYASVYPTRGEEVEEGDGVIQDTSTVYRIYTRRTAASARIEGNMRIDWPAAGRRLEVRRVVEPNPRGLFMQFFAADIGAIEAAA